MKYYIIGVINKEYIMKIYELAARFDARKSFYHKAMVGVTKNKIGRAHV